MMPTINYFIFLAIFFEMVNCTGNSEKKNNFPRPVFNNEMEQVFLPEYKNGNIILNLTNNSGIEYVDSKIYIDDKLAIYSILQDEHGYMKGNVKAYRFNLSKGRHSIKIVAHNSQINIEKIFEISATHWAHIDYGFENKCLFLIQDKPILFKYL